MIDGDGNIINAKSVQGFYEYLGGKAAPTKPKENKK